MRRKVSPLSQCENFYKRLNGDVAQNVLVSRNYFNSCTAPVTVVSIINVHSRDRYRPSETPFQSKTYIKNFNGHIFSSRQSHLYVQLLTSLHLSFYRDFIHSVRNGHSRLSKWLAKTSLLKPYSTAYFRLTHTRYPSICQKPYFLETKLQMEVLVGS